MKIRRDLQKMKAKKLTRYAIDRKVAMGMKAGVSPSYRKGYEDAMEEILHYAREEFRRERKARARRLTRELRDQGYVVIALER